MKPSGHTNYYGLMFGGSGLEGPDQSYLYFVVAQNGTWLIKRREGNNTSTIAPKTPNDAVKKPGADGKSTNALEVRVGADKIDFVVNGTVVHTEPKGPSDDQDRRHLRHPRQSSAGSSSGRAWSVEVAARQMLA